MPVTLCQEHGWKRNPIDPVFFAPYEIQPGDLDEELKLRLRQSKNLIVICSPHSARSEWVGKEISYFHQLGRTKNILFFIIEGQPNSGNPDTECFNPILKELDIPEILGANINDDFSPWKWIRREHAYVQLITKLLGIGFDTIWQRHKRHMLMVCMALLCGLLAILALLYLVWVYNQPVDVSINFDEQTPVNAQLPNADGALLVMRLGNEEKRDTIDDFSDNATIVNIPRSFIGKKVRLSLMCDNYQTLDTTVLLRKNLSIPIWRNPERYGHIHFKLWNPDLEKTYPNEPIRVDKWDCVTDQEGVLEMEVPIDSQKEWYRLTSVLNLDQDRIVMPCNENTIVIVRE